MQPNLDKATLYVDFCEFLTCLFQLFLISVFKKAILETQKIDKEYQTKNERYLLKYCVDVIYVNKMLYLRKVSDECACIFAEFLKPENLKRFFFFFFVILYNIISFYLLKWPF